MRIICISDTHEQHTALNQYLYDSVFTHNVDMIICAGDTANNKSSALNYNPQLDFIQWFSELPFKYKLYVPGNHNTSEHKIDKKIYEDANIIRLLHQPITIENINFFGSPYTPTFGEGWAFNVNRHKLQPYWEDIPFNTDILITHGPPKGILDVASRDHNFTEQVGCKSLLNRVFQIQPQYHIFGHLHDEDTIFNHGIRDINGTRFVNASIVDLYHKPVNTPIIIEI